MKYWLIKSEPFKFSWDDLVKLKRDHWDGVRNYAARNNMKDMKVGDHCLFYHSNEGKEIVGIAKVVKESYQDPTTDDDRWVVVDVEPYQKLNTPVTLHQLKTDDRFQSMELIRLARLSVSKVTKQEYDWIMKLAK